MRGDDTTGWKLVVEYFVDRRAAILNSVHETETVNSYTSFRDRRQMPYMRILSIEISQFEIVVAPVAWTIFMAIPNI